MQPIYDVYMMLNVDRTLFLYKINKLYLLPENTRVEVKVTEKTLWSGDHLPLCIYTDNAQHWRNCLLGIMGLPVRVELILSEL